MKKLLLVCLFSINLAHAGILVEPFLGYSIAGGGDVQITASTVQEHSYSAITLGGRAGWQMLGLMAGVEYSMQTNLVSTTGAVTDTTFDRTQLGLFVGYNLPIMFRVWGTYFLTGSATASKAVAATSRFNQGDKLEGGSGMSFGVGFTGFPLVSLNAEYRTMEYADWKRGSATVSNVSNKNDFHEILLSVSLPFTF